MDYCVVMNLLLNPSTSWFDEHKIKINMYSIYIQSMFTILIFDYTYFLFNVMIIIFVLFLRYLYLSCFNYMFYSIINYYVLIIFVMFNYYMYSRSLALGNRIHWVVSCTMRVMNSDLLTAQTLNRCIFSCLVQLNCI